MEFQEYRVAYRPSEWFNNFGIWFKILLNHLRMLEFHRDYLGANDRELNDEFKL